MSMYGCMSLIACGDVGRQRRSPRPRTGRSARRPWPTSRSLRGWRGSRGTSWPRRAWRPWWWSGCRRRPGDHTVSPFLAASSPGSANRPMSLTLSGLLAAIAGDAAGQDRVVRALALGQHLQAVLELRRGEVLVHVAGVVHLLLVLEALDRGRRGGELGLVLGVLLGEVRLGRRHVVEVAEHEQLRGPGVLRRSGSPAPTPPAALILALLAMNSAQVFGTCRPSLL